MVYPPLSESQILDKIREDRAQAVIDDLAQKIVKAKREHLYLGRGAPRELSCKCVKGDADKIVWAMSEAGYDCKARVNANGEGHIEVRLKGIL